MRCGPRGALGAPVSGRAVRARARAPSRDAPLALVDVPRPRRLRSLPTRSPRSTSSSPRPTPSSWPTRFASRVACSWDRSPPPPSAITPPGSNHVLPTGGAGRFMGPLSPGTFRRDLTTVLLTPDAVEELAPTVATLANAEGFPVHGESAIARTRKGKARVSRTAKIERKTKETEVSLQLDLDGGEASAPPGVGFLDHMLDLLARHGRLGHGAEGEGRPGDRVPTTRPRTSASCSGRRSTRRWGTGPASAATARRRCRWTRRWPSARSTSRAGR